MFFIVSVFCVFSGIAQMDRNKEVKRHNFGIGFSAPLTSSTNQFLKDYNDPTNMLWGRVDKNLDLNFSVIYEFNLNNNITFGIAPTYRFSRAKINYISTFVLGVTTDVVTNNISDIDLPLFVDYKISLMNNNKLFFGLGASCLFNINADNYINRDTSPYLLFRMGFDVNFSHRIQFLLQYRYNIDNDTYYKFPTLPWPKEAYRVNTFDVGVNFFL